MALLMLPQLSSLLNGLSLLFSTTVDVGDMTFLLLLLVLDVVTVWAPDFLAMELRVVSCCWY